MMRQLNFFLGGAHGVTHGQIVPRQICAGVRCCKAFCSPCLLVGLAEIPNSDR